MENHNSAPADAIVMRLENLNGKTIAFRSTPKGTAGDDPLCKAIVATAAALGKLDAAVGAVTDPNAPPMDILDQRKAVAAPFTALQIRMASVAAAIDKARTKLAADQSALYSPPAVSDVAGVLLDVERRAVFAVCDPSEKDQLWERMAAGELGPLLAALGRLEFTATASRAGTLYRALAAERDPSAVAAFDLEDERLTWAQTTLDQITATVDASTMQLGPADAVAEPERKAA